MHIRTLETEGPIAGGTAERSGSYRRNTSMPRGGKLLSGEQSLRLAIMDNVDRDTLIAHIVDGLRAEQRARDTRPLQALNRRRDQEAR